MNNYIHYKVWDEITYPFPNFNGTAVGVWEWISNFIPHFVHVRSTSTTLDWRHIRRGGASNHWLLKCLFNSLSEQKKNPIKSLHLQHFARDSPRKGNRFHIMTSPLINVAITPPVCFLLGCLSYAKRPWGSHKLNMSFSHAQQCVVFNCLRHGSCLQQLHAYSLAALYAEDS